MNLNKRNLNFYFGSKVLGALRVLEVKEKSQLLSYV